MTTLNCSHWLWASGGNNPSILHSGRLQLLTSSFDPQAPCPSLNILIGSRQPIDSVKIPKRCPGALCLDLDLGTDDSESLLLANAALPPRNLKKRFRCCSPKAETSLLSTMSDIELEGLVYSRLLYPFIDTFCFYSYGLSDLAKIARWIATWPSQEHTVWKPSLMVLLGDKHLQQPNAAAGAEQIFALTMQTLTSRPLSCCFSDYSFIPMPNAGSPATVRAHLHQHVSVVRQRRRDAGLLLSAEHLNTLFERAFESAATLIQQPLDPICSARRDLPVSTDLTEHLINFMGHLPSTRDLLSFASPFIASSLLCDHYLPDMHFVDLTVRIRPPTAGHSILCIDGGGIRGIIPPAILGQVQEQLDLPIPIQEFFTLAYGVSAGALIVLAMFANGWSVEQCGVEFEELARFAFKPPSTLSLPGVNWIRTILSDAIYSESDIEAALKRAFGETTLTETSYAKRIGAKIGIPAATINQPSLCLFTNYNGSGRERRGYEVLTNAEAVKTWEVSGRSCSAALLYFPAKYLAGLGTFQDAGVLANNPIIIALAEFAAMNSNAQPDLVLNIGTGTSPDVPLEDQQPRFIKDSWLIRLKRGYMSLMQGKKIWDDATSIDSRAGRNGGRYRLDLTITHPPALDDTASMPMLTSMVYRDVMLLQAVPEIAYHLFATLFYFELDALPRKMGSNFHISGRILCTRKGRDRALPKIVERLRNSTVYINGRSTRPVVDTDRHGNIHHGVECTTGQSLLIELKEAGSTRAFPLSGSPYSVSHLITKGSATAVFGTRTHKKRVREVTCSRPSKRRRRCVACLYF
ncbi:hypothetical protein FPOA_13151 [Fusarium poae]|uniref:PNPLA domain-containing protein n=1 Tax=Fusarium poae TaxID=36050 RepID=A0A1B8A6G1_FUSPO|nr:hypothetical protein FPOA_13151 [Fusarium poae]